MPSGLETVPCKQRRRCVECYKNLAADKGSQYARDHTKRTLTRCNRCKTHFCVNCYDPAHLCRPGELTTYCINAEEIHSNAFNEAVDVKYSRESTPPGLEKVPSKKRRRCVECYNDLSAVMGSYYARDHARKTHTRCVRCKTFFCVKCYDPGHRCGPRETT
ncbi:hypothetical protein KIN20_035521 [Parelaphostrongylus tenuis]|uniref:Uncharacterized protein n=1 Tax=Parelaphostrongylus tenuis TaxID=148309 RepID=A0AAD5RBJ1_PARTN|nr:hypothetical protein KIN20_035521 [Parelaphostrongylus tenuis]